MFTLLVELEKKKVGATVATKTTVNFENKNIQEYLKSRMGSIFCCLKKEKIFGGFF